MLSPFVSAVSDMFALFDYLCKLPTSRWSEARASLLLFGTKRAESPTAV